MERHWCFRILRWFCPPHLLEEIEGDLLQRYERDLKNFNERKAKRKLLLNTIRFFRPGILLRSQPSFGLFGMTFANLKFSWRSLQRNRLFSTLNLVGLVVGITVFLLILNFVLFERSYDKSYVRSGDIVRVGYTRLIDNEPQFSKAQIFPAVAEVLKSTLPEVKESVRIFPVTTHVEGSITIDSAGANKIFSEQSILAVDSTFLKLFPQDFLSGNPKSALQGDNKVLLSESMALKYFNSVDVVNRTLYWRGMGDYLVTGVFKDTPPNSHMKLNILTSWMNVYEDRSKWNWDGFYTYLLLKPNIDRDEFQSKMQMALNKEMQGVTQNQNQRVSAQFFIQPVESIHLDSNLAGELEPNGNKRTISTLLLVALLILLLALTNYINLFLAKAIRRAKEVSVRKINGSTRFQVASLFFTESFVLSVVAVLAAILLMNLLLPYFNMLSGRSMEIVLWHNPVQFAFAAVASVFVFAWLASLYPAGLLASRKVGNMLKGDKARDVSVAFRKLLLSIQFVITIALAIASFLIQRQISFMQQRELGFSLNHKVVIKTFAEAGQEMDTAFVSKIELFKSRLKQHSTIQNATITSNIPGRENEWLGRLRRSEQDKELISTSRTRVDKDFLSTYGLTLSAGRNFETDNPKQIILNQSAAKQLGFTSDAEAVGTLLMKDYEVVGVVKDFHQRSLHEPILPYMFTPGQGYMKFITVDVAGTDPATTVDYIKNEWQKLFDKPFDYFFLDDFFNLQYGQEHQLESVFNIFSLISIIIACLGLFGFTYYMVHQRLKEIGIRKALGANFTNLIKLLSSEVALVLLVSAVLASAVSYYFIQQWLEKYPVRITTNWIDFFVPICLIAIIAYSSIVMLLIRAIKINPTKVLKSE